ncbi:MAG TPA: dephospho-CoA kinase [Dehalococcoidia bacterium]|nr:dephospho-CoA kinase [Dehalococcoidia bacterium]
MIVIGLTGGIASGKSTISQALERLGATIVDADKVGHEAYQPNTEGWHAVVNAFGPRVVAENGEIDRRALGAIVFADPAERRRLESIVWPVMKGMMRRKLDELRERSVQVVVLEAAVLIEADWLDLVDAVWVVTVPPSVAAERLIARNGLTPEQAQARIAAQLTNEERGRYASVVIDNSGPIDETVRRVETLWQELVPAGKR